jgi:solute carrier family 13 (sodium-dependent dicarboxylate transporter), member 2/3/5
MSLGTPPATTVPASGSASGSASDQPVPAADKRDDTTASAEARARASAGPRPGADETQLPPVRLWLGRILGPLLALAVYFLLPADPLLTTAARTTAAVVVLVAVWWMTEAIPLSATALVPLVAFPLLGVLGMEQAAAPYAAPTVFLFMGGFMLALAMQKWNLHKRIALLAMRLIGTRPRQLVLGVMVATAFLSMWVSNTATTLMMLPIGLSVLAITNRDGAASGAGVATSPSDSCWQSRTRPRSVAFPP